MTRRTAPWLLLIVLAHLQGQTKLPDGLYAVMETSKGRIVARLEPGLTPMTVANFVGLAEGTIANAAFDLGRPFYDGSIYHRVVSGHVIQTGIPQSDRAKNPGYLFPNEIHAKLSHNRAGVLNMANSGPNTNAAQFCITLGDRSYLDGDFNVFGEVVDGMDVVMRIVQGDVLQTVRILRMGPEAATFHPTTESFRAMVQSAEQQVAVHKEKKSAAEAEWIAQHYPRAIRRADGVLLEKTANADGQNFSGPILVRYRGKQVRYMGNVIGRQGPPVDVVGFISNETGLPDYAPIYDKDPQTFPFEPGKTKAGPNGLLDVIISSMHPGERCVVIIPAALGYGKSGFYPPEVPGRRRFVVSPNALLAYDVEVLSAR